MCVYEHLVEYMDSLMCVQAIPVLGNFKAISRRSRHAIDIRVYHKRTEASC
jgi:hypothetical protein